MTNAVQDLNAVLEQAKAAAAQAVAQAPTTTAVSTAVAPARPVSMLEMLAEGGMSVKAYLKVDKPGFTVGSDTSNYIKELEVEFRIRDAKPFYGIRYGNPAKYLRSFDRVTETRTRRPWSDALTEAQRLDPKCKGDYRAVELPFVYLGAKALAAGGDKTVEKGETLGWTSSITNWKVWEEFIMPYFKQIMAGELTEDALLRGKIVHEQKKDGGNTWGLVTFSGFEVVAEG